MTTKFHLSLLFVLLKACYLFASSPEEDASASIAVAQAAIEIGKEAAPLPDKPPQTFSQSDPQSEKREAQDAPDTGPRDGAYQQNGNAPLFIPPMRMQVTVPAAGGSIQKLRTLTVTGKYCHPCHLQREENGDGNDKVQHDYIDIDDAKADKDLERALSLTGDYLPMTTWRDGNGTLRYISGKYTTAQILEIMHRPRNTPPMAGQQNISQFGPAGTIHASAQIRQGIKYLRKYVDDGNAVAFIWDRNGAGQVSLFATKDWTTLQLFGNTGRIELNCPGIKLPVTSLGMGYRIVGRDLLIDAEPVRLIGLADKLSPSNKSQAMRMTATPVGIIGIDDVLEVYWIFSMIRDLASILMPSCDLILPGQISCSTVLNGDEITVDFSQPVTVRLVALFTFNLAVKRVVVTEKNVHVEFSGSRWIHSRDFAVQ